MFERFTKEAREVVTAACERPRRCTTSRIRPAHLVLAASRAPGGVAGPALRRLGLGPEGLREAIAATPAAGGRIDPRRPRQPRHRPRAGAPPGRGGLRRGRAGPRRRRPARPPGRRQPFSPRRRRRWSSPLREALRARPQATSARSTSSSAPCAPTTRRWRPCCAGAAGRRRRCGPRCSRRSRRRARRRAETPARANARGRGRVGGAARPRRRPHRRLPRVAFGVGSGPCASSRPGWC